jgi:hypothetical protein
MTVAGELRRWMIGCSLAEAVGMLAAAAAARGADAVLVHRTAPHVVWAVGLIVAAGMVEGTALGLVQAGLLRSRMPGLLRVRYVIVTVVVAGLGWAAGSLPSLSPGGVASGEPPRWLLVASGVGAGVALGAVLGLAQGLVLRAAGVKWRTWVVASAVAWAGAFAWLMVGASIPDASWPVAVVLVWAAATGAVAGAALGAVLGWFVPSLLGAGPRNRVVMWLLTRGRPGRLNASMLVLEIVGHRTGRRYRLPVMYAGDERSEGTMWVLAGRATGKSWWRNLTESSPVVVLEGEARRPARATLVLPGDAHWEGGRESYRRRFPRARVTGADVLVRVDLVADDHDGAVRVLHDGPADRPHQADVAESPA